MQANLVQLETLKLRLEQEKSFSRKNPDKDIRRLLRLKQRVEAAQIIKDLLNDGFTVQEIFENLNNSGYAVDYSFIIAIFNKNKKLVPIKKRKTKQKGTSNKKQYPEAIQNMIKELCRDTDWSFGKISRYIKEKSGIEIPNNTISRWCRGLGAPRLRIRASLEQKNKAISFLKEGLSISKVSKLTGLSIKTVSKYKDEIEND